MDHDGYTLYIIDIKWVMMNELCTLLIKKWMMMNDLYTLLMKNGCPWMNLNHDDVDVGKHSYESS